ncbi:MAG: carboxylesterase/lipase family protein [Bacteriovoracia bacterium]
MNNAFILLVFSLVSGPAWAMEKNLVPTTQGLVRGQESNGVFSFKGIPFAQPPVGDLRWRESLPAKQWVGVRDASDYGAPCMQTENFNADGKVIGSEDCLTLNIWQPKDSAKPLPVMVFIYGGAFSWGSSRGRMGGVDIYDGTYLSSHGPAVVVTFNYRVGAFGFLAHPSLRTDGTSGNYGLSDQILALEWVQKNIANFGGDPARVMIFGESAGAFSVLGLLTSPAAKGLFSRALLQSGSDIRDTAERAEKVGVDFAAAAGCEGEGQAKCLRALDQAEVMRITKSFLHGQGAKLIFSPHVDGKIIPDFPLRALRDGKYNRVPVVVGANADEMTILGLPIISQKPIFLRKDYESVVRQEFGEELGNKVIEQYGKPVDRTSYGLLQDVFADNIFHCPAQQIAEVISRDQPGQAWRYVFSHSYHLDIWKILGAGHGLELSYVFHNFAPWYVPFRAPNQKELELSERMVGYWTRFAANGNPNADGEFGWRSYSADTANYLDLELPLSEKSGYRAEACAFWQNVSGQ